MECEVLVFLMIVAIASPAGKQHVSYSHCARMNCGSQASCLNCVYPDLCNLGEIVPLNCTTVPECSVQESTKRDGYCNYCWQLHESNYDCAPRTNCSTTNAKLVTTTCEVHSDVICKGNRRFSKRIRCNWSSGLSWTKTMILSITLGGFGADRFYLGLWKSAIGKLFSFGGLGIWTVVDIVLIATGYIRPADGSMYM